MAMRFFYRINLFFILILFLSFSKPAFCESLNGHYLTSPGNMPIPWINFGAGAFSSLDSNIDGRTGIWFSFPIISSYIAFDFKFDFLLQDNHFEGATINIRLRAVFYQSEHFNSGISFAVNPQYFGDETGLNILPQLNIGFIQKYLGLTLAAGPKIYAWGSQDVSITTQSGINFFLPGDITIGFEGQYDHLLYPQTDQITLILTPSARWWYKKWLGFGINADFIKQFNNENNPDWEWIIKLEMLLYSIN